MRQMGKAGRGSVLWMLAAWLVVGPVARAALAGAEEAGGSASQVAGAGGPPVNGPAILAKIYERVSAEERAFPGNFSRRKIVRRELDPDDGEVRSTRQVEAEVWGWAGGRDRMKILRCEIDGAQVENDECEPQLEGEPIHSMFGPRGREHYDLEFAGAVALDGEDTWRVRVVPKEETVRHFQGDLFFRQTNLSIAGMEGGVADHPFGLKALRIRMRFADKDGRGMLTKGHSDAVIYVPLLVDARLVTDFVASDQRLLSPAEKSEYDDAG